MSRHPELGVIFPTKDIGNEPDSLLRYGPEAEYAGFDFIAMYDHVVGVDDIDSSQTGCEFNASTYVHEPMVALSAIAAVTKRIQLITACLISPQRPTALVAKQAAELDIVSNGRLELGLSIGWNEPEFEALGANFSQRALRLEEQVRVLHELWSGNPVSYEGGNEHLESVSLNPTPIQEHIPIWIGGLATKAIVRASEIGDGWLPLGYIDDDMRQRISTYKQALLASGEQSNPRIMGRVNPWRDGLSESYTQLKDWQDEGASHVAVGSSSEVYTSHEQHFRDLAQFRAYFESKKQNCTFYLPPTDTLSHSWRPSSGERRPNSLQPKTLVITGTHSAGKSTLLMDFTEGKLTDIGVYSSEYNDLGYAVVVDPATESKVPVITVPEAATWLIVEQYGRPDLLGENYTQEVQNSINSETVFRTHYAAELSELVVKALIDDGQLSKEDEVLRPIIVTDRSLLDGLVYGDYRSNGPEVADSVQTQRDFCNPWTKTFVDSAASVDHTEVEFEQSAARLDDEIFRDDIAQLIDEAFSAMLHPDQRVTIGKFSGNREERKRQLTLEVLLLARSKQASVNSPEK